MKPTQLLVLLSVVLVLSSCASAKRRANIRQLRINTVINTALSYTGTPYRWGGTTREGMDCSGLLYNAYSAIDFSIPRTSIKQSKIGKKVGYNQLAPGDLVFFATGDKKRKITHVGMVTYLEGDRIIFIHASSSLGVVESDLNTEYYRKRFITARRPF